MLGHFCFVSRTGKGGNKCGFRNFAKVIEERERQEEGYPAGVTVDPRPMAQPMSLSLYPAPQPCSSSFYFSPSFPSPIPAPPAPLPSPTLIFSASPSSAPAPPSLVPAPQTYSYTPIGLLQPPVVPHLPRSMNDFSSQACFSSSALTQPP